MHLGMRVLLALALFTAASAGLAEKHAPAPAVASTVAACSDFYTHVNQGWLRSHPLPVGARSLSRWDELNTAADAQARKLLSRSSPVGMGTASVLLADLVASSQDATQLDTAAHAAAAPLLAQIDAARKPRDITRVVAAMHAAGVPVLFGFGALRDPSTGQPRATFYAGGIGLPDRAYYSTTAPELQRATQLYRDYITNVLRFSGVPEVRLQQQSADAWALEQSLAAAMSSQDNRTLAIAQAGKSYPSLFLPDFMQAQGVPPQDSISVQQASFFSALDALLTKPSIPQWQAYLRVQLASSLASTLAVDPRHDYLAALNAGAAMPPGWSPGVGDRLATLADGDAADLLSEAYGETAMSSADEQRAAAIAETIRVAMARAIDRAAWLRAEGKAAAHAKLSAMRLEIGRPRDPPPLSGLQIGRQDFAGNVLALRRWNRVRALTRLNNALYPWPVSQTHPLIGYQPPQNRLIVTASALRPPALELRSVAASYGSFGALVAQQLSLAFADFTNSDGRALAARQAGLLAQFSSYAATASAMVNSALTQRQNAADLAAVELSWDALAAQGTPDPLAAKEFFSAWASVWARQDNAAALAAPPQSPFAPAKWRVNGPLANTPAFITTYGCKPGQAMYRAPAEQLSIWR